MSEILVFILEDDPFIAEDIRDCLSNADYQVAGLAHSLEKAEEVLKTIQPDIALLDINLGDNLDGLKVAEKINKEYGFPFIFLSSYSTKSVIEQAKYTRPMGYIVKPFDEADLFTSIEIALYNYSQQNKPKVLSRTHLNNNLIGQVTEKEFEVLMDIYEGRTNKQMASKHFVSINTIKTHVQKIYEKLDVNTRASAIARLRSLLA